MFPGEQGAVILINTEHIVSKNIKLRVLNIGMLKSVAHSEGTRSP